VAAVCITVVDILVVLVVAATAMVAIRSFVSRPSIVLLLNHDGVT
jgi:hypothetical protein